MNTSAGSADDRALAALAAAADSLFYRHGVVAVSMAQVRDESGLSMRRMYSLCPSKADLITLWLNHRHQQWMDGFTAAVDRNLQQTDAVTAVFDALRQWMVETDFRGCGFINTHGELSELTDEHRVIIRDHKAALADYLGRKTTNGPAMAVLVDGATVQAAIFADTAPIDTARAAAVALDQVDLAA